MPYTIEEHRHRFAAWAAGIAVSRGTGVSVELSQRLLKDCVFNHAHTDFPSRATLKILPDPGDFDSTHREWRNQIISNSRIQITHGIAAKMINVYLKALFVCGGHHDDPRVKAIHPPIDRLLLTELSKIEFFREDEEWNELRTKSWTKFDSEAYEKVIELIKRYIKYPQEPLWKIEEHWQGHQ